MSCLKIGPITDFIEEIAFLRYKEKMWEFQMSKGPQVVIF